MAARALEQRHRRDRDRALASGNGQKNWARRTFINSKQTNPVEAIRDIYWCGVAYSLRLRGPQRLHTGDRSTRIFGTCGSSRRTTRQGVSFDVNNLMIPGKGIRGILEGEKVPDIFIPQLIELKRRGASRSKKLVNLQLRSKSIRHAQGQRKGGTIKTHNSPITA